MTRPFVRRLAMIALTALTVLSIVPAFPSVASQADAQGPLYITYHRTPFWPACVQGTWHGSGYNEDAIDIDDVCGPTSGLPTVYFRSQGLNQYWVEYTLSAYGGNCTGRRYTMHYWVNNQWSPLVRLNYVHLDNMRASSQGQLTYAHNYAEWVGTVAPSQPMGCLWTGIHLHFSRSTNYGLNVHNGATGFGALGTTFSPDEIVFITCQYSC